MKKLWGETFKKERHLAGISQRELSKELNYSTGQYVSNVERSIAPMPLWWEPTLRRLGFRKSKLKQIILQSIEFKQTKQLKRKAHK